MGWQQASQRVALYPSSQHFNSVVTLSISNSSRTENEPQVEKDEIPISTAGIAQLQRTDGAFPPTKQIYAVLGGTATRDHFKALFSQPSALASSPQPNESSPAASSKNNTKGDGGKALTSGIRRMVDSVRRSASSTNKDSDSSEWDTTEILWATLLVLAFLELKLADEADMWVLMAEKARAWVAAAVGTLPVTSEGGGAATIVQTMEAEAKKVVEK